MSDISRVAQALFTLLLTLLGLLLVTFSLSAFSPGGSGAANCRRSRQPRATYDQVRHQLGLDHPCRFSSGTTC